MVDLHFIPQSGYGAERTDNENIAKHRGVEHGTKKITKLCENVYLDIAHDKIVQLALI